MTRPSFAVQRAIYGRLAGDTMLNNMLGSPAENWPKNIYYDHAAENAGHPFVVFSKQSSIPIDAMKGGAGAIENEVWLVKTVDRSDNTTVLNDICDRIVALLGEYQFSGQVTGRTVLYCRRIDDLDFPEVLDGVTYRHAGSTFRLYHQAQ